MKKLRMFVAIAIVCLITVSFILFAFLNYVTSVRSVKNVILLIGDGMGVTAIRATQIATVGPNNKLSMQTLPYAGLVTTHSLDSIITDSAASGTAMATGYKTNNGIVSMLPNGTILQTILEYAETKSKSTGLVVTSRITHATPATFASHVPNRGLENDIALDMLYASVEVLLGGGRSYFLPEPEGYRTDGRNLVDEALALNYTYLETREDLLKVQSDKALGLFAMSHMSRVPREPSLVEMTNKAIELLSQDNDGFFLMVEGSQIDWAGHGNNATWLIDEVAEFDKAVEVAIDFAIVEPSTLVIVTADHETGGMAINGPNQYGWTTRDHTSTMVPVFANGPRGSPPFATSTIDNTDIARVIFNALKYESRLDDPRLILILFGVMGIGSVSFILWIDLERIVSEP